MIIMSIGEEQVECPLCMEPLEMDDINFFPCTCGYQICRFCWHRIRTDENGLCPACRKAYPEDPAEFRPLTEDELQRIKKERKLKDALRKQKAAESRKHLANVRVVQRNLVFVVGLSQRLGDVETLRKHDYFGKFGKIVKVVINQSTTYAGSQGPSASAYITYYKSEDALRAIQAVNNLHVDGRTIKASLGTTKYCSHFLKGTQCPKGDCMYLHELGEETASFTKEEMQQGKHTEYEQKLIEAYMNHLNTVNLSTSTAAGSGGSGGGSGGGSSATPTTSAAGGTASTTTQSGSGGSSRSRKKKGSSRKSKNSGSGKNNQSQSSSKSTTPPISQSADPQHRPPSKPPCLLDVAVVRPPGLQSTLHRHSPDTTKHRQTNYKTGDDSSGSSNQSTPRSTDTPSSGLSHSQSYSTAPPSGRGTEHKQTTSASYASMTTGTITTSNNSSMPSASAAAAVTPAAGGAVGSVANPTVTAATPATTHGAVPSTSTTDSAAAPPASTATSVRLPFTQTQATPPLLGSSQRAKSLFGDPADNMSLFGLSGFPVRKPGGTGAPGLPLPDSSHNSLPVQESIPDTISVSSATDWSAAFGFKPSLSSATPATNGPCQASLAMASAAASEPTTTDSMTTHTLTDQCDDDIEDDLGFDPWNESTKALQDLMEKESSGPAQPNTVPLPDGRQLPSMFDYLLASEAAALRQRHLAHSQLHYHRLHQQQQQQREGSKVATLPPGFTPGHMPQVPSSSAFMQPPMMTGSRMMSLMNLTPSSAGVGAVGPSSLPGSSMSSAGPHHPVSMAAAAAFSHLEHSAGATHAQQQRFLSSLHAMAPSEAEAGAGEGDSISLKDWQEGLRALLPNINISFGSNQQQQQQQPATQRPQKTHKHPVSTNAMPNNYDLLWDPAVVTTGNVATENGLSEEPHWMASLQSLTDDGPPFNGPVSHTASASMNGPPGVSLGGVLPTHPVHKMMCMAPGLANPTLVGGASSVTTPPPGFQHPVLRFNTHPLLLPDPSTALTTSDFQ